MTVVEENGFYEMSDLEEIAEQLEADIAYIEDEITIGTATPSMYDILPVKLRQLRDIGRALSEEIKNDY